MPVHDELGITMKTFYEQIPQFKGEGREYIEKLINF